MKTKNNKVPMALGIGVLSIAFFTSNLTAQLPSSVANRYKGKNASRSDDFSSMDWNRWARRNHDINGKGCITKPWNGLQPWQYAGVWGGRMRIYGKSGGGRYLGSGFSMKKGRETGMGFYETKMRFNSGNIKTIYHPSIWSANWNNSTVAWASISTGPNWLELDLMEYDAWKPNNQGYGFGSHMVPRINNKTPNPNGTNQREKYPNMVHGAQGRTFNQDVIWGCEYNDNYIRTWRKVNGTWQKYGQTVWTSWLASARNFTVDNKLYAPCRKQFYWIISNISPDWQRSDRAINIGGNSTANTDFQVDYFNYYPAKSGVAVPSGL